MIGLKWFVVLFLFIFSFMAFGSYINNFSASVNAWNNSNINEAVSLINMSLSSTINVANAANLWYFKARLDLMDGKLTAASNDLNNAVMVFKSSPTYTFINSLISASFTAFLPIVSVKKSDTIHGIYKGNEIFYSPVSIAVRENGFYVLDAANRNVIEFSKVQSTYPLGVNSTPTAIIYSPIDDRFYVSFENGSIYSYSPDFNNREVFLSNLSFPVIFCQDNAGRFYVGEYGKDAVDVFENNGALFRQFDLFSKRVHIFSYGLARSGIFYLMDLTDREIRRFDLVSSKELSPIPFPSGPLPYDFSILGDNIVFFNSNQMVSGGINFNLEDSKSVFYADLSGQTLLTVDPVSNTVRIYKISLQGNPIFPVIDRIGFQNGNIETYFRIVNLANRSIEYLPDLIVKVNGSMIPFSVNYVYQNYKLYLFPDISQILSVNKNVRNVVIVKENSLDELEKYFGTLMLRNVALFVVGDPQNLSEKAKLMIYITGGTFISESEIKYIQQMISVTKYKSLMVSFPVPASLGGINSISIYYGANSNLIDTVYYTDQNILSK